MPKRLHLQQRRRKVMEVGIGRVRFCQSRFRDFGSIRDLQTSEISFQFNLFYANESFKGKRLIMSTKSTRLGEDKEKSQAEQMGEERARVGSRELKWKCLHLTPSSNSQSCSSIFQNFSSRQDLHCNLKNVSSRSQMQFYPMSKNIWLYPLKNLKFPQS